MASDRQPLAETSTNIAPTAAPVDPKAPKVPETKAGATKSTKRKGSEMEKEPQVLPEIDSEDERLRYITEDCDQIRRKINNFINSGEMKVGEFQRAIGVSSQSYLTFLGQSGKTKGMGSSTYFKAARFFKKRELQGLKPPRAKATSKKAKTEVDMSKFDVSNIRLGGEEEMVVPIYETCDSMRTKIRAFLRAKGISQAALVREMEKCCPDGRKFQSASLTQFLGKKGPRAGHQMGIFYAAYVYFEKLRIKEGRPKSQFRLEMEDEWACLGGFDIETPNNCKYVIPTGFDVGMDKYGRIRTFLD